MRAPPPEAGEAPLALSCFTAGMALALVASGGVLAQRLSRGDVRTALIAQLLATSVALFVFRAQIRRQNEATNGRLACLALQCVGASCGIVTAHALLHASPYGALPWLSEQPAQFVNDAVAVFAPLAVIWASVRRPPKTAVLVLTLGVVTAYRVTAFLWHHDAATFALPVQDLVSREFAGSAIGITIFRHLVRG